MVNGQFQMTVRGAIGQSYSLLASTDLVNWVSVLVFTNANSSTLIIDPSGTNFSRRFYKIGP